MIYVPAEAGPFAPVSRGWSFAPSAINADFNYVIFDWDNIFAACAETANLLVAPRPLSRT